jgi:hypothetical protein
MKYNLRVLKADILDELEKLRRLKEEFANVEEKLERPEDKVPFFDRAGIGYYLHCFYNGCENIFRSVARFFENDLDPQTWHSDLLKRMKLSIEGFRPAVIDEELFHLLNDFRMFRHVFRQAYTFDLNWQKELLLARKFNPTYILLDKQVRNFLHALEDIDK